MSDDDENGTRVEGGYGDGSGFEPLAPVDVSAAETVDELVRQMAGSAFGGRRLGEAADVLQAMVADRECFVVGTFSGAMTVAKQGLLLCEMIESGMIHAVVATGALIAHGLVESVGMRHFKYREGMDDRELYYKGYDRVYDTLELEQNLDDAEAIVDRVLGEIVDGESLGSREICERIGRHLVEQDLGRGILGAAFQSGVPVYIPAFTDSEVGLDFAVHNRRRVREGREPLRFEPFRDLEHYAGLIAAQAHTGIFTIGGGVPRNWAQQVGPYLDILEKRLGTSEGKLQRFRYGVRICPEPVHWGGLSGCTYSEGVSWGKFVPESEGGRFAEVLADATIAWPVLLKAVLERMKG